MEIIINSWRTGTRKQYQTYVKKWLLYSKQNKCNIFSPILQDILDFFVYMHTSGSSYSAICTARSAFSSFINIGSQRLGSHPLVNRFITGIYNAKPSTPRYTSIWDTDIVLRYLVSLGQNIDLSLKTLTLKLCMLLSLITAQRGQTLQYLDLDNMQKSTSGYVFVIAKLLKQSSRSGRHLPPVELCSFSDENKLCIVELLNVYIEKTAGLRTSRDTIARWIKTILRLAGIDITIFKSHSTRGAAVSKASAMGTPLQNILTTAGWSSDSTFAKHYNLPIIKTHTDDFAKNVISGV